MAQLIRKRPPLITHAPITTPYNIVFLMSQFGDKINTRPVYQRDIRWSEDYMADLINTVMRKGYVPPIILYKLQPTDDKASPSHTKECVDGQHRIFSIYHYFFGKKVVLPGRKPFLITWQHTDEETGRTTHVFYARSDETDTWISEHSSLTFAYMTQEEQTDFGDYPVSITEFNDPMTLQQRREIFCGLQKGTPVRGSDLYKNYTEVPVVRFIVEEMAWESELKEKMFARLTLKAKNFWLHWFARMYIILRATYDETCLEDAYMKSDADITKMFKDNSKILRSTPGEEDAFQTIVYRFFGFLDTLPSTVIFTPTHFYALYTYLITADIDREDILHGHMSSWSKEGVTKEHKKMWENRSYDRDERVDYFNTCIDKLDKYTVPAREPTVRKTIPKKIRSTVWKAAFGENMLGTCCCCKEEISYDAWECSHVISHASGGADTPENMRPQCQSCNRSQGTENLFDFKNRCYSHLMP